MTLKNRLEKLEIALKEKRPETLVIVRDRGEEVTVNTCRSMQGDENKRLHDRLENCSIVEEIKEATKETKIHLIVIKAKHLRNATQKER